MGRLYRHFSVRGGVDLPVAGQQVERTCLGDRLGAPLHLELFEDPAVVPFHRVQGEIEPRTDLTIGEPFCNELEDFSFAGTERLDQQLCCRCIWRLWFGQFLPLLGRKCLQQPGRIGGH